ncbi:MAG: hypothetical protein ISR24_07330 [Candidatus Poseidonia sp.]|nr:hypothetical protein [Poseidonia sp.]
MNEMGLLDKAGAASGGEKKELKKAVAKTVPKAVAKAVVTKQAAKPKKDKPAKAAKARPISLSDDYELASPMNRRISWLVNFIVNFGVLFAAIFIAASDTGIITTILFAISGAIIIINIVFIPMKFSRNMGQFVSRTKFVRGDGSNPFFLHGILVNSTGLAALIGTIFIAIYFSELTKEDNMNAIILFSLGTIFVIIWFIDRFLRNGSEMGQGLFDLMFKAYLVKYVPSEDEKATGVWARLENMGNFGDQLMKRTEERKAKKEAQKVTKDSEETADAKPEKSD